jgi:hypothetical protein
MGYHLRIHQKQSDQCQIVLDHKTVELVAELGLTDEPKPLAVAKHLKSAEKDLHKSALGRTEVAHLLRIGFALSLDLA